MAPFGGGVGALFVVARGRPRRGHGRARRRRIADDVALQQVDRSVEGPVAQLVLQFGVVEQRLLGDRPVETVVGGHGERLHGRPLVAGAQVAVGQVVGGVLREGVLGAARATQPLHGVGIAGRAVEREAHQVVGVAVGRAPGVEEGLQVLDRAVVVVEAEPRLGHHTLDLGAPLGYGPRGERPAAVDHIAVVALAELDLEQIVGNHVAVGVAALERQEGLLGPLGAPLGVVDVGPVVAGVVGILAVGGHAAEVVVGRHAVALGEGDVAHADVVLHTAARRETPAVGALESLARTLHVARRAVVGAQREAHVVGVDRAGIAHLEVAQHRLGVAVAQFDGASCQIEVDLLALGPIVGREGRAGSQELVPGVAPAAEAEQIAAAPQRGERLGRRTPGGKAGGCERHDAEKFGVSSHMLKFGAANIAKVMRRSKTKTWFCRDEVYSAEPNSENKRG